MTAQDTIIPEQVYFSGDGLFLGRLSSGAGPGEEVTAEQVLGALGFPGSPGDAATFVQNSGQAVNDASTFGGYTLAQLVQALQDLGVLS